MTNTCDGTAVTTSTVFTENATLFACWIPIYTITFDANGGAVTPASGATGTNKTLASLPTPTMDGYTFGQIIICIQKMEFMER